MKIQVCVPLETRRECYDSVIPNLLALLEENFGEPRSHSVDVNVRRTDIAFVDVLTQGVPGGEDSLTFVLNSVVTTLGHEYSGQITDEDSGKVILQMVFVHT